MNDNDDPPPDRIHITPEMRRAVAEEQCDLMGHDLEPVRMYGHPDPAAVTCHRCGREWNVDQR